MPLSFIRIHFEYKFSTTNCRNYASWPFTSWSPSLRILNLIHKFIGSIGHSFMVLICLESLFPSLNSSDLHLCGKESMFLVINSPNLPLCAFFSHPSSLWMFIFDHKLWRSVPISHSLLFNCSEYLCLVINSWYMASFSLWMFPT